jgi:hypothetical protein
MNQSLKEIYRESKKKYTHSHVIEILKSQQKFVMKINDTDIQTRTIAEPNQIQEKIQNILLGTCGVA